MIITIDGPAGTGKSTVAKQVAKRLGFLYFDTGAMFRAIAYGLDLKNIDLGNEVELTAFLKAHPLLISTDGMRFFLGDKYLEVTDKLRDPKVSQFASKIATLKLVRDTLKEAQRRIAKDNTNTVFEGRDMGTAVFPAAECKIFLTASPEIRARRRYDELIAKGAQANFEQVLQEIKERDERDMTRAIAPLKPADDAVTIDTSLLTIDEVVAEICDCATKKQKGPKDF